MPTIEYRIYRPITNGQWERIISLPEGQMDHAVCMFQGLVEATNHPLLLGCQCGGSALTLMTHRLD